MTFKKKEIRVEEKISVAKRERERERERGSKRGEMYQEKVVIHTDISNSYKNDEDEEVEAPEVVSEHALQGEVVLRFYLLFSTMEKVRESRESECKETRGKRRKKRRKKQQPEKKYIYFCSNRTSLHESRFFFCKNRMAKKSRLSESVLSHDSFANQITVIRIRNQSLYQEKTVVIERLFFVFLLHEEKEKERVWSSSSRRSSDSSSYSSEGLLPLFFLPILSHILMESHHLLLL